MGAAVRSCLVQPLADLVLPQVCAGCGRPDRMLCPRCLALLARPRPARPRRHPAGFPPTVAAGGYAGAVRPMVNAFKERGRTELAAPLGAALALAVAAVVRGATHARAGLLPSAGRPVLLVPLPSSRAALRVRGRDPVRELTGVALRELRAAGLPASSAALLGRAGRVRDSAGLAADQRRANLAGSFVPHRRTRRGEGGGGHPAAALLVLVDDVATTGATLTEAARTLAGLPWTGSAAIVAAVVAATPQVRPRRPIEPGPGVFSVRAG